MTYEKPEINVLGDASRMIQGVKNDQPLDGNDLTIDPAYSLDE
jgi:hypothetical protein